MKAGTAESRSAGCARCHRDDADEAMGAVQRDRDSAPRWSMTLGASGWCVTLVSMRRRS